MGVSRKRTTKRSHLGDQVGYVAGDNRRLYTELGTPSEHREQRSCLLLPGARGGPWWKSVAQVTVLSFQQGASTHLPEFL